MEIREGIIARLTYRSSGVFILLMYMLLQPNLFAKGWHPEINHRPRLVFLASELETIRARLASGVYNQLWSNDFSYRNGGVLAGIYQKAALMQEPILNTEEQPRKFADSRSWIAKCAAFVYAMNKRADGEKELNDSLGVADPYPRNWYRDHAIEYLQSLDPEVLGPNDIFDLLQNPEKADFVNNWQWRAKELIYYCQAYDMLLGMDVAVPDTVGVLLERFAQNLYQKYTVQGVEQLLLSKNNHRLMSAAALGLAAVTLNDSQYADNWIELAMNVIQYVLYEDGGSDGPPLIDSDGGYAEGPYYFRYSFKHLIPFFIAMRNFNGDWTEDYNTRSIRSPWYDPAYYMIYDWVTKIRMPEGRLPALEDSYQDHYLPDLAVFGGYYVWPYQSFDENFSNEALLNWQLADPFDLRIDYIVAGNADDEGVVPPWDKVQILTEAGSAVFKGDWGTDAVYFHLYGQHGSAREGGSTHDHADVTSFILGYKGQVLALDAGYIRFNYHYRVNKPENHNVILVDGYGPRPPSGPLTSDHTYYGDPSPTDGYLQNKYISEDFAHVEVHAEYGQHYEMIDSLNGQEAWEFVQNDTTLVEVTRSALFVDNRYFILSDRMNNRDSDLKRYQLLIHGNGGGTSGGDYERNSNGASWTRGSANLVAYVTAFEGGVVFDDSLFEHGDGFLKIKTHECLRVTKEDTNTQFLSLLFPCEDPSLVSIFENSTAEYTSLVLDRSEQGLGQRFDLIVAQMGKDTINIPGQSFANFSTKPIKTDAELLLMSFDTNEPDNPDSMKIFGKNLTFIYFDDGRIIFNPDGEITSNFNYKIDAVNENNSRTPIKFSLKQNYPNPFNPITNIEYRIPNSGFVTLKIYNALGQKVATLVNRKQKAGIYSVEWDASGFASGVYYYRLQAEGFVETKKLILLR